MLDKLINTLFKLVLPFVLFNFIYANPTINNGDFEEGSSGNILAWNGGPAWFSSSYPGYHGKRYAYMHTKNNPTPLTQTININSNKEYTLKFVAACGWSGCKNQQVSIYDNTGKENSVKITNIANNGGLKEYTLKLVSGSAASKLTIKIDTGAQSDSTNGNYLKFDYFRIFEKSPNSNSNSDFKMRYYNNLNGNIRVIGNTVLQSTTPDAQTSNADMNLQYVDIDSNSNTFNSSSATIESVVDKLNIDKSKIVWAGLYWLGYLHNDQWDEGIDNVFNFNKYSKESADSQINSFLDNHNVYLKVDNEDYVSIKPDKVYKYRFNYIYSYVSYIYSAFADVTSILKDKSANHTYTVANIPTRSGKTRTYRWGDGLGNFSAWSLVIVYDNSKEPFEKTRNVTVYDGFKIITGWIPSLSKLTIDFSGFKTPKYANDGVDSTISIFAAEGDKYILGDKAVLTNQEGYSYKLPAAPGTGSYFASSIDGVPKRNPKIDNNNGIDIHVNQIGTKGGDDKPIKTNHSRASLTLSSKTTGNARDLYVPTMVAFTTELFTPKVCYDYSVKLGEYINIDSKNREFSTSNFANEPLQIKLMLRSKEADFDLIDSKMSIKFTPDNTFKYKIGSAKYSPPNTYEYIPAVETNKNIGEIAVGHNPTTSGGAISAKETTYSKLYYNFKKNDFNGKFDINLNANISFDGVHKVNYSFSTDAPPNSRKFLPQCPTNQVYNPLYGIFNVERGDSTFTQNEEDRYSLYTQVVGVPYQVSVASYTKDGNGKYNKELKTEATVELELINGDSFDNNSSAGYDSTCQNPESYNKGVFVNFNKQSRVKVDINKDYSTYPKNLALKKAIFRVWALTQKVNDKKVVINHKCKNQYDSGCFDTIYKDYYKDLENSENKFCLNSCTNSSQSICYDCLRKHYGTPLCSRDNFAIRPDSYSIAITDNNQSLNKKNLYIGKNSDNSFKNIAAGYLYNLDINATQYEKRDHAQGYYFVNKKDSTTKKSIAQFIGLPTCLNRLNHNLNISINNGKTDGLAPLKKPNQIPRNRFIIKDTGDYALHIEDLEWTKVDHKGYKYRPFPNKDDCIKNSITLNANNANAKRGCDIKTNSLATYPDLKLKLHPYSFDINSITAKSNPNSASNYLYINDLNKTKNLVQNGSIMALKVAGNIVAISKDGTILNNYTSNCSAYNLNIKQNYSLDQKINSKILNILYDANIDKNKTQVSTNNIANSITTTLDKKYFYIPATASYNCYYNLKREYNNPINPFNTTFSNIEVSSPNEKIYVDMQKNYIPKAVKNLNTTKTLYYARVKSESDFYDDIYTKDIETPIKVTIFCNKSLDYCSKYGIDISKSLTSEYDWWLALNHSGTSEGKALLQVDKPNSATLKPTSVFDQFTKGVDSRAKVERKINAQLPLTVLIQPTNQMITNYPWLLYNKHSNTPPTSITKVRFVKSSAAWSGKGKTGYATDYNSTGRKTKKVDW